MSDNENLLNDLDDLSDEEFEAPDLKTRDTLESQPHSSAISKLATLLASSAMKDTLRKISELENAKSNPVSVGVIEDDPEYKVIVAANALVAEIDSELVIVIKHIRDYYEARFRGLDTLVTHPLDYVRTVQAIGAEEDVRKIDLAGFLSSTTVLSVNIANQGLPPSTLTPDSLKEILYACQMALDLDLAQKKVFKQFKLIAFVESRMTFIAPNLSAVVGTATAAKLLGASGGLVALSKIPACNLLALGSSKTANTALSKASLKLKSGYLYYSESVTSAPPDLRNKMARIVCNKASLAARIDRCQESRDGSQGRSLKEEVMKKLDQLVQPPPIKNIKALPVPDEGPKKRRGGRKMRRIKESMAVTELRRAANRMNFGEAEDESHGLESMVGLGLMGTNRGQVRAAVTDTRNKTTVSKRHKAMLAQTSSSNGTATSGLTTSLAFTPAQGLELENPEAKAQRIREANDKYFGTGQGFRFVAPKKEP